MSAIQCFTASDQGRGDITLPRGSFDRLKSAVLRDVEFVVETRQLKMYGNIQPMEGLTKKVQNQATVTERRHLQANIVTKPVQEGQPRDE